MTAASPPRPSRRGLLKLAASTGAAALAAGIYGRWVEVERLTLERPWVPLPGIPAGPKPLRVGFLTDLRLDDERAVERARRAVAMLLADRPDVVLLGGDYVSRPGRGSARAVDCLEALADVPGGVFAVLGSHDWWRGEALAVARRLSEMGFQVLRNRSVELAAAPGLWLTGLDDRCVNRQQPDAALKRVPRHAPRILLIHEPDYADETPAGFVLQVSGHSHGGQVRVPGIRPLHLPRHARRYPEGLQRAARHPVCTSRGVGVIGTRSRLFCPPEVTVLELAEG